MINKKNVLGKTPMELGDKDAIHIAIVSVRAAEPIKPGARCGMNANREAIESGDGVGVADPFRDGVIRSGESFWLLLNQDAVPNVQHVWTHPTVDFSPPATEVHRNKYLAQIAERYGVTYEQLMDAAQFVVVYGEPAPYPGSKSDVEVATQNRDRDDLWYEWAEETGYEFPNYGSVCCPETEYPDCDLFECKGK